MDAPNLSTPDIKTLILASCGFIVFFGLGLMLVDDGKYDEQVDYTVGPDNSETTVEFDNRNITLIYEEASEEYFINIGENYEGLDIEGNSQRIHAVDDNTYMFYFQKNDGEITLFRIERL